MRRHGLIMLLCCLIPIGVLAALWAIGIRNSYLALGAMLLCPLLHLAMMGTGQHDHKSGGHAH